MKRRLLLVGAVLAVAGATAAVLVVVLGGSNEARRAVRSALRLERRIRPTVVRLQPTKTLPRVSAAVLRRLRREGHDEHRSQTRAASPGSNFVSSATTKPTVAQRLARSPRQTNLAIFGAKSFSGGRLDYAAEPHVAQNGDRILETWNWGAALSSDGGRTFTFADPDRDFGAANGGFCCDQLAYYVPRFDLWVWLLQYIADANGNILRLAVARGTSSFDAGRLNRSSFRLSDLSPSWFGWPASAEFDFNGISSTRDALFISTNVIDGRAYDGLILRIPLAALARGAVQRGDVTYFRTGDGTVPRLVHGAASTMYFASHKNAATLTVWSWADGSTNVFRTDVPHDAYNARGPFHCRRTKGPRSADWCEGLRTGGYKNDDTILAGWVAKGRIGFAWDAGQDKRRGLPYPYVMTVEVDQKTLRVADETIIWSAKYAFQYPAIAPNARGDLGGIVLRGGGKAYESCTAVVHDRFSTRARSRWEAYTLVASNHDPASPYAGDYLGAAPAGGGSNAWAAACMTLRGGSNPLTDLHIHWLAFGRARDRPR